MNTTKDKIEQLPASALFALVLAISFFAGEGLCKGEHPGDFGIQAFRIEMIRHPSVFIGSSHEGLSNTLSLVFFDGKLDSEGSDMISLDVLARRPSEEPAGNCGDSAANNDAPYNGVSDKVIPNGINHNVEWWLKFLFGVAIGSVLGPLVLMRFLPKDDYSWMSKQAFEYCSKANGQDQGGGCKTKPEEVGNE